VSLASLGPGDLTALRDVAARLGVAVDQLAALIDFETAGTWDPAKSNPYSSARGLLQFLDGTARDLGYEDAEDLVRRHPTVESQLRGPVLAYLSKWAPFATDVALAMSVFYPAFRGALETQEFPEHVQAANPGIVTVGDYVGRLRTRLAAVRRVLGAVAGFVAPAAPALLLGALAVLGALALKGRA
jgi:hypothetical protein